MAQLFDSIPDCGTIETRNILLDAVLDTTSTRGSSPDNSELEFDGWIAVREVMSSPAFERSPTLRNLLQYLWEHREEDINEYAIGTEALRRKADFDPRSDATVRVLVSRLRQRLKDFYEKNGSELTSRLVLPVGTYNIKLLQIEASSDIKLTELQPEGERAESIGKVTFRRSILWVQFATILVLGFSVAWLVRQRTYENARVQSDTPYIPAFWRQFFGNGRSARVIVPTPTFFIWRHGLLARDVQVNDFMEREGSAYLDHLKRLLGEPLLAQQYVASYDAIGAFRLIRYLDADGLRANLYTTAQASLEDLNRENVILEGNSHTLTSFSDILKNLSFQVQQNEGRVVDLRPAVGRPTYYNHVRESASRTISPGIIASIPGGVAGTHTLVLLSQAQTSALVDYLISDRGIKELERAQAEHGNCQYFEAVVMLEIDGSNALSGKIAAFRPYGSVPEVQNPK